jgi:hypothetical protein
MTTLTRVTVQPSLGARGGIIVPGPRVALAGFPRARSGRSTAPPGRP